MLHGLDRIEVRMREAIAADGLLGTAAADLALAPAAQRARPRLLLAFASLARPGAASDPRLVEAGAAIELIHTASLLHDDIVDEAGERRGRPSANARYGNAAAVLVGDWLLGQAFALLAAISLRALENAVAVVVEMSRAALREVEVRGRIDLPLDEQTAIARGKTGGLFGLCGRLAGLLAGERDAAAGARFEEAGRALGMAFQAVDDLDELLDDALSKNDLIEKTPTLPILLAARDPEVARALATLWAQPIVDRAQALALGARIARGPALGATRDVVDELVARTRALLRPWQHSPAHAEIMRFATSIAEAGRGERWAAAAQ